MVNTTVALIPQESTTSGTISFAQGMTSATVTIHVQIDPNETIYIPGYSGPAEISILLEIRQGVPGSGPSAR